MKIAIDLNQTLHAHHEEIIKQVKSAFNLSLTRKDFNIWNPPIAERYGLCPDILNPFMWSNRELEMSAKPFAHAVTVVNQLFKSGHTIEIITATQLSNDDIALWLDTYGFCYHDIVRARSGDKFKHSFDYIIDDSPVVINSMIKHNRKYLIVSDYYNHGLPGKRFDNWLKVPNLLD